jgi:hypothetical protein
MEVSPYAIHALDYPTTKLKNNEARAASAIYHDEHENFLGSLDRVIDMMATLIRYYLKLSLPQKV